MASSPAGWREVRGPVWGRAGRSALPLPRRPQQTLCVRAPQPRPPPLRLHRLPASADAPTPARPDQLVDTAAGLTWGHCGGGQVLASFPAKLGQRRHVLRALQRPARGRQVRGSCRVQLMPPHILRAPGSVGGHAWLRPGPGVPSLQRQPAPGAAVHPPPLAAGRARSHQVCVAAQAPKHRGQRLIWQVSPGSWLAHLRSRQPAAAAAAAAAGGAAAAVGHACAHPRPRGCGCEQRCHRAAASRCRCQGQLPRTHYRARHPRWRRPYLSTTAALRAARKPCTCAAGRVRMTGNSGAAA